MRRQGQFRPHPETPTSRLHGKSSSEGDIGLMQALNRLEPERRFSLCHLCGVVDRRRSHFVNRLHSSLQIGPQLMWNAVSAQSIIDRSTHLLTPAIDTWHASISIPHLVWFRRADQNRYRFVGRRSRFDIAVVERNQDIRLRIIGRD
jgi:hypothetical protein